MPSSLSRALTVVCALALGGAALPASSAAIATVHQTSQITSPSGGELFIDEGGMRFFAPRELKVQGTASGIVAVDIRCYRGNGETEFTTVQDNVSVISEHFETEVLLAAMPPAVCELRAVPHESTPVGLGPGAVSSGPTAFEGPLLATSVFASFATNYFGSAATFVGSLEFESAGEAGLESVLYSTLAHQDEPVAASDAYLPPILPMKSRASLQVDGVNGYTPAAAVEVGVEVEGKPPLPGTPEVTVSKSFDESTHEMTIQSEEPIVKCAPASGVFPPRKESCTSFAPTGVTLVRTWQSSDESHLARMTDSWRSTDGTAHAIDVRYVESLRAGTPGTKEAGLYRFPGDGSFAATHDGDTKTLPSGAGVILYKAGPAVPDSGDGVHAQAAIAYDTAPAEPVVFTTGSASPGRSTFEMPYRWTVPAGGSSPTLRMALAQSFVLGDVSALSEEVVASYHPTVTITSPGNGASIASSSPVVTVSGNAGDGVGLAALTVNGHPAGVGAGGAWSIPLTLAPGANVITAVAQNQSGLSSTASVTVTYVPAAATTSSPAAATARALGAASGSGGKIHVPLACQGTAGQRCRIALSATTLERLSGARSSGVAARHTRRVTVASATVTIAAGHRATVTVPLNRVGRALLARFGKLPTTLSATVLGAAGRRSTILRAKLTIRPARGHRAGR